MLVRRWNKRSANALHQFLRLSIKSYNRPTFPILFPSLISNKIDQYSLTKDDKHPRDQKSVLKDFKISMAL